ncbi:hypothetical protein INT43_002803 [Umbelopsis isabellina]|uniref:BZIP domain-containing protein n=1 Tax=Mortierella isabellina TaxID=91625 RepID=A0A8H7UKD3_MORIS|nr:hypothetical protein INT43_002803 [Umbelopsis isabellina]
MEPKLEQQEQDELLFSFLNTDCVDSSYNMQWSNMDLVDPPSPPYSTSSGDSIAHGSGSATEDFESSTAVDILSPDNLWQFMSPIASDDGSAALCNTAFQPMLFPAPIPVEPASPRSSPSASDSEPNKRKRGRKAKTSASPASTTTQLKPLLPSVNGRTPEIAVRPAIAPSPNPPSSGSHVVQVKAEPVDSMPLMPHPLNNSSQPQQPQYTAQQAAMAKRQERLIKNRAAALLSRKRKREHLTTLEEENTAIKQENDELREQVAKLTAELQMVRTENEELRGSSTPKTSQKNTKATGMVFMIMLFSFALFSLPNGSVNRLTVGGSSRRGLIGSSNLPYYETNQQKLLDGGSPTIDVSPSTEVMVVESIKAHDLQSWIQESLKLDAEKYPSETESQEPVTSTALVQYSKAQTFSTASSSSPPLYLYAGELSQVVRLGEEHKTDRRNAVSPRVSLLSPLVANPGECEPQQYLQVDMQVISSKIVGAQMIGLKDSSFVPLSLKDQLVTRPSSALGGSQFNNTDDPARKNKRRRSVREASKRKAKVVV